MGIGLYEEAECECILDAHPSYYYQIHFQDDAEFRWAGHFDGFVEQIIGEAEGDPDVIADRRLDWTEFKLPFKLPGGVAYEVAQAMAYGIFDNLEIHYRLAPGDRMVMFVAVNIHEDGSCWSTPLVVVSDRPFDEGWMYEDPTGPQVTAPIAVPPTEAIRPVSAGFGVLAPHRAAVGTPEVGPARYNGGVHGLPATETASENVIGAIASAAATVLTASPDDADSDNAAVSNGVAPGTMTRRAITVVQTAVL
jgi:hypothetical protein